VLNAMRVNGRELILALALLAATSLLMARIQPQVRVIGAEAAPRASTALR
jgi:hypothetical protein